MRGLNGLKIIVFLLCLALFTAWLSAGCGDDDDDRSTEGGEVDDDDDMGDDDDDEENPFAPGGGDPLNWSAPLSVATGNSQTPSVRVYDADTIHAAYYKPVTGELVDGYLNWVVISDDEKTVSEPSYVTAEAYKATWLYDGDDIQLIATRARRHVLVTGKVGEDAWVEVDGVDSENTGQGSLKRTAALTQDSYGRLLMAFGYEKDGTGDQTRVSYLVDGQWQTQLYVGGGMPAGVYFVTDTRVVVPSDEALYVSENSGVDFDDVGSGSMGTTPIRAADADMGSDGSIWMVAVRDWDTGYRLTLIKGAGEATEWDNPLWVLCDSDQFITDPKVAVDGDLIVAAWCEASGEQVGDEYKMNLKYMASQDGGETWSDAQVLAPLALGVYGLGYDVDANAGRAAVILHSENEGDFDGGIYLFTASFEAG